MFLIQDLILTTVRHLPMQHATMAVGAIVAGAGILSSVLGGVMGGNAAKRAAQQAADEKRAAAKRVAQLEASRQQIINPYAGVKDLSGMAKDLSGMISNTYANLGVATQAAKFQAEQVDISLANTLDTLKETGGSAGGATALAQAALQSKKGISATIEAQEAENEKLRAQGEQQLQQVKMAEAGRIQGIQMSEAGRVQQAEVAGKEFVFNKTETRQQNEIDRISGQATAAANREAQANADRAGAKAGMISGITSAIGGFGQAAIAGVGGKGKPGFDPADYSDTFHDV